MTSADSNYLRDPRVRALSHNSGLVFDQDNMTLTWTREVDSEDGESTEEVDVVFNAKFDVCPLCEGRGSHVNPSIDAGGISSDDEFWEDDVDEETGRSHYASGRYDVSCYQCKGLRVVGVISADNNPEEVKAYEAHMDEEAAFERESLAERLMGA